jgi:ABC-2 type transport system ATP-binding protein
MELGKIIVRAPGTQIVKVAQEILTQGPVADITIEDIPLEDVIADLFEKN